MKWPGTWGRPMKTLKLILVAAVAASLPVQMVAPAPVVPAHVPAQLRSVLIPFDPPIETSLRYRWERSVQKNGKTDIGWSVSDYRFEETKDGYRLIVTPVSSGSNETDPAALAFLKRLEELFRQPFVLRLDENGSIQALENADVYWSTMFKVMREELGRKDGKPLDDKGKQMLDEVIRLFEGMPAQNRLSLMTEEIQPLVEFGNVELDSVEPISASVEVQSPFGGTLTRDTTISLKRVEKGIASLSIRSFVPKEELTKLVQTMFAKLESLPPETRAEAKQSIAAFKQFEHVTAADYDVSMEDGVLTRYHSVETIVVEDKDGINRKITTQTLTLVE